MKHSGICLLLITLLAVTGITQAYPQLQTGETSIAYGDTVTGNLTATTAAEGDRYTFEGSAGDTVIITLESDEFDTILDLLDAADTIIATNDDAQGETNSMIAFILPAAQMYTIVARNFGTGTGAYTLTLQLADVEPITVGQTIQGTLDAPAGNRYGFSASQGDTVTITLQSEAFDTYLELFDTAGTRLEYNDDAGSTHASQITYTFVEDGDYMIVARTYNTGTGDYTLTLEQAETSVLPGTPGGTLEYGQSISGSLSDTDGERYTFVGTSGVLVIISLESADFDTYLTLLDPSNMLLMTNDDGGEGSNSQIAIELPESGAYTIVVGSYNSSATSGSFDLSLELAQPPDSYELSYGGEPITAMLMDPTGDEWTFSGTAGEMVDIVVLAETFTSMIDLIGPDGALVASNITASHFSGSELVTTLPATGTYTVVVSDYAAYQNGMYTISVQTVITQPIEVGETVNGELVGPAGDRYTFTAEPGVPLIITMNSTDFDTYLEVYDTDQNQVTYNDDAGSTSISRIFFTPSSSETYTIVASSYRVGGPFASYSLSLETAPAEMIEYREPVQGTLSSGSADYYSFQGTAGDTITIVMQSGAFDTYLELYDPDGALIMYNDDSDSTSRSEIGLTLESTGLYIIVARSSSSGGSGEYTLDVMPGTPPAAPGVNPAQPINYGDMISGTLISPNTDSYEFEGRAGDIITITMTADFDTYLELYDADMDQVVYNDDAGDGSLNSKIENFALPADGTYTIYARGLSEDASGPYTLTLNAVSRNGLPTDAPQIGVLSDVACGIDSSYFVFTFDPSQESNFSTFQASVEVDEPGGIVKIIPVGEPLSHSFTGEATISLDDQVLYLANATSLDDIATQINEALSSSPAHSATLQIDNTEGQPPLSFLFWVSAPQGTSGLHGTAYWIEQPGQPIQSANYSFVCP